MPVILALVRLSQEDCLEFEVGLGYIVNSVQPELNSEMLSQNITN